MAKNDDIPESNEMDQILGEISTLQAGMASAPRSSLGSVSQALQEVEESEISPEELAQVVDEVEKAVEESTPEPVVAEEAAPDNVVPMEDFRGREGEASLEETLGSMKEDEGVAPVRSLLDVADESSQPGVEDTMSDSNSNEGSLTLALSGSMTLKLRYQCGDQEVTIGFVDQCLRVEMADGTEFKIPVRSSTNGNAKAA